MKKIYILICYFLFYLNSALAQQYGIDTLASAVYPEQLRNIPNQYAISGFAEIFGNFFPVAQKELEHGRSFIRVPFLFRDNHYFDHNDLPAIKRLALEYENLCIIYPGKIEISPLTEYNVSDPDIYLDVAQRWAPHCTVVATPWKGPYSKKYKNEIHGITNKALPAGHFNYSFDGTSAVDADVENIKKKYARADHFFFWTGRENCRWGLNDLRSRAERIKDCAKPTKEYFASELYLAGNKGLVKIPRGWLIKSHSERHNYADTKGDKLLIISPVKANEVILKKQGKAIARLPYYGPYAEGGFRYYYTQFGYKLGKELEVWANRKQFGIINGGFRAGTFRE